jgi:hypothetical protein
MNPSIPSTEASRRGFFQLTLGWLAAIFAVTASAAGAVRFLVPNVLFEPDQRFKAGKPDDYLETHSAAFRRFARTWAARSTAQAKAIIARVMAVCLTTKAWSKAVPLRVRWIGFP